MNSGKFSVVIELGNDAMRSRNDVADALKYVAKCVAAGRTQGPIIDVNGNKVGKYGLETE